MAFTSLYRKYRSQTFEDLIGQDHIVRTLQNGISSNRVAHAYLFTGPRGTGKTSTARLLAKALCCENGPSPEPCNVCELCVSITEGSCIDVHEFDAASESGVDEVRDTIVQVIEYKPAVCRYKVFIIDEVHDLSSKAFDALLKTVEEPPAHIIFILATTEFNKVPPTIRSRCQKYEFHRATIQNLVARLQFVANSEGIDIEPAALASIAMMADGGYRDALTLLEQAILTAEGKITQQHVYDHLGMIADETVDQILTAMSEGNVANLLNTLNELNRSGRDPRSILESAIHRLADLTRVAYGVESGLSGEAVREASAHALVGGIGRENLLRIRSALAEAHKVIRDISLPRVWLEAELLRISEIIGGRTEPPPQKTPVKAAVQVPQEKAKVEAKAPWDATLAKLQGVPQMKLANSKVVKTTGTTIVVSLSSKMTYDWLTEDPRRLSYIGKTLKEVAGEDWAVDFSFEKDNNDENGSVTTVELPAEGQKLVEMIKNEFDSPTR